MSVKIPPDLAREEAPAKVVASWPWQNKSVILIPYDGTATRSFPEDFLVSQYFRMRDDGALGKVFPHVGVLGLNQFVNYLSNKPMVVVLSKPTYTVAGFGWLWEVTGTDGARRAIVGFAFHRGAQGTQQTRDGARLALAWWFTELNIDVVFGSILASNRIAENFSRKLGFEVVATIPNWFVNGDQFEDARLVTLTKVGFLQREVAHGRRWSRKYAGESAGLVH